MKVTIELQQQLLEPYAIIYTNQMTDELQRAIEILENDPTSQVLALEQEEKYIIVKPSDIYMVRFEEQRVVFYGESKKYTSRLRLYEVEEKLGRQFMRISKTTLINLAHIDSVEPSFSGTMCLRLKNGCKDNISRRYLVDFKKYLGL
ncbi:MAG TPA: LytTR family DNA-binding domain-containing protein [Lachnospiraceae bacterium]|nr:LytTR family DNA-binding domain-containing protein [Lachnospiraceae bacterium]